MATTTNSLKNIITNTYPIDFKKTGVNFVELETLSREKVEKIELTILPWQKQHLPSYHGVFRSWRSYIESIAHSLISSP